MATPEAYIDFTDRDKALKQMNDNVESYAGVKHSKGNLSNVRTFMDYDRNISVKSDYNRADYEYFRPSYTVPKTPQGIIAWGMETYKCGGLVKNIIDLMADFASQGIRILHPNKTQEDFYRSWFEYVCGAEVSERFVNYILKCGTVVAKRRFGKVPIKEERKWRKLYGAEDGEEVEIEKIETSKKKIPLRYDFLNPLQLDIIGGAAAVMADKPIYVLKVNHQLKQLVSSNLLHEMKISYTPEVMQAIKNGASYIMLDQDKLAVYHYKKDDWCLWGEPLHYCIANQLMMLEKMHLADMSALDGAISNIRLWTLGIITDNPQTTILPSRAAINKVREVLHNSIGGGTMDLVWGPELKFSESNTQVHRFLGDAKYTQVMNEIFAGLGVPSSLTAGGSSSGFTNNFVGMKTLIERLRYCRAVLTRFWRNEIKLVQKSMGFKYPATVTFDETLLTNDAAEKALLVQLIDRDIVSAESVREKFGLIHDIEEVRVNKEYRRRKKANIPDKAGPFHNPQMEAEFLKILIQHGGITPSELGIELEPRKEGEETILDIKSKQAIELQKYKPVGQNGRPKNAKDSKKRKSKTVKPRQAVSSVMNDWVWASSAQKKVSEILTPCILNIFNKTDVRGLTTEERAEGERLKFTVFTNLQLYQDVNKETVYNLLKANKTIAQETLDIYKSLYQTFLKNNKRQPAFDELKNIQTSAFILTLHGKEIENSEK